MSVPLFDSRARADAARAIALIEKHVAVCEERGRAEEAFQLRTEDFLARLKAGHESAVADIRREIGALGDRLRGELAKHQEDDARTLHEIETARGQILLELAGRISAAIRPIYNRFWALALALIGALATLSGFLVGKLLGWL